MLTKTTTLNSYQAALGIKKRLTAPMRACASWAMLEEHDKILDMACADAVNAQPVMAGSILDELPHVHHDHFNDNHPETNWMSSIEHAVKLGIGSKEYELIKI